MVQVTLKVLFTWDRTNSGSMQLHVNAIDPDCNPDTSVHLYYVHGPKSGFESISDGGSV